MVEMKKCTKCGEEKELNKNNFYLRNIKKYNKKRWDTKCIICIREYDNNWVKNNPEKVYKHQKKYRDNNKEKVALKCKKYDQNNKRQKLDRNNRYKKKRNKRDPIFRLMSIFSREINLALKGNKGGKSIKKYLPFTDIQLRQHIEDQFKLPGNEWMNWNNQGIYKKRTWNDNNSLTWRWNIDHIIPQSCFDIKDMGDEEFLKCWALENLRPYSAKQNILDGNRREGYLHVL